MKKILLLGERSYAASGLYDLLKESGYAVDCFSRGSETRSGDFIQGDVFSISKNNHFADTYDFVINFIIIKDDTIEKNLDFVKELDRFCKAKKITKLLQISSISAYPSDVEYIDETSNIETDYTKKGGYGAVKVAVDQFLMQQEKPYSISFIRPGFIYTDDYNTRSNISGIGKGFSSKLALIMGNKKTPLTLINRNRLHQAILRIVETGAKQDHYLIFENNSSTKDSFLRKIGYERTIGLNKPLILLAARIFNIFRVLNNSKFEQVKSLFRQTFYSSYSTEFELDYSFLPKSYCIIGAGTYGSYLANKISKSIPDAYITIFDVGNEKIKDEDEIGYKTNILKDQYIGTAKGRFFGFGGASTKWGGQLLTFSENDFKNPNGFLKDIVKYDNQYRDTVFENFNINNSFAEKKLPNGLFIKTGIWLGYFQRNLFKFFKVDQISKLTIVPNSRVVKILREGKSISGFNYIQKGVKKSARFDQYFLTSGAFESFRILLNSELTEKNAVNFSDHLSKKMFVIKGSTKIGEDDFAYRVNKSSLITKRIIGEIDDVSFYFNPKYNDHFPFFQNLKALLFKKEFSVKLALSVITDLPNFIAFLWSMGVKKRIYTYQNKWLVDIDIENPTENSSIKLSTETDAYGEKALDLTFNKNKDVDKLYEQIKILMIDYLTANNVDFELIDDEVQVTKTEDTYHPYGMLGTINSAEEYFNMFDNFLVVNTGILPRAGGINTAAAVFPMVEEYVNRMVKAQ